MPEITVEVGEETYRAFQGRARFYGMTVEDFVKGCAFQGIAPYLESLSRAEIESHRALNTDSPAAQQVREKVAEMNAHPSRDW